MQLRNWDTDHPEEWARWLFDAGTSVADARATLTIVPPAEWDTAYAHLMGALMDARDALLPETFNRPPSADEIRPIPDASGIAALALSAKEQLVTSERERRVA